MILFDRIALDIKEFVNFFIDKYKYDKRGILKGFKMKSGLNKQLNEDIWCNLFIKKSAYNYCAKFLLIKLWEDKGKILSKINKRGIEKWEKLVSNLDNYYSKLYEIAEMDLINNREIKDAFKNSDYDIFKIDNELAEFMIKRLMEYDFSTYNLETINQIFTNTYLQDEEFGYNLQYFYKPAYAIEFILDIKMVKEKLV
ncbi:hypothetical protein [Thermohalobacter berrensis]|uniref:Uncharacterized protein n=1 Tax=Thermohalobacter berrensis TaxID=99594 RepID=A0A419T4X4_9FIRM|nr:hypothetical protein [Thermohalobacter berrensis]RKD32580.1 hypothetical protein BET03_10925 [Thermohalobacter berrensis]